MFTPTFRILTTALFFVIAACGGSGGGGSEDSAGTNNTGGSGSGNPTPPGSGGGSTSSASIIFPSTDNSNSISGTVKIRGTAADADGIAAILVNGQPATIYSTVSQPPANKIARTATGMQNSSNLLNQVGWTATVNLQAGNNDIAVSVEDGIGNVEVEVDSKSINYIQVPINFSLDESMNRVIGSLVNYPSYIGFSLVDYDYVNLGQTVLKSDLDSHLTTCFKGDTSDFLYVKNLPGHEFALYSYNLLADQVNLVTSHTLTPVADGFADTIFYGNLTCRAGNQNAYLLINYMEDVGGGNLQYAKSAILELDLASGNVDVLTETDVNQTPRWIGWKIVIDQSSLISMGIFGTSHPLVSIDLATGAQTELAGGLAVDGMAFAPNLDNDVVYVVAFDGVYELDIVNETYSNISVVSTLDPFVFTQVRKAAFDAANNRVIVSDEGLDMLLSVDVSTGQRTDLLSHKIGTGTRIIAPRRIATSADSTTAYIGDDGDNGPERLFKVDLLTGAREEIGVINQPFNELLTGLALDEINEKIYVSFPSKVLEVDLDSEVTTVIASNSVGSGTAITGISDILLDAANNRLLLADAVQESIIELNLSSGARSVFSEEGVRGEGEAFANINSLAFNADESLLYISNQQTENIMSVDAVSGDREIVLDECIDNNSDNVLGAYETLQQVFFNPADDSLFIVGDNLLNFNPATGQCSVVQPSILAFSILAFNLAADGRLFAIAFKSLGEYDVALNDFVIISK